MHVVSPRTLSDSFFEDDFSLPKMAKQSNVRMVRFWDTILQQELPVEDMGLVYLETVYPM